MNAFRGIAVRGCVSPYLASLSLAISAERPWRVVCTVSTFRRSLSHTELLAGSARQEATEKKSRIMQRTWKNSPMRIYRLFLLFKASYNDDDAKR